jgi:hypothetical protein
MSTARLRPCPTCARHARVSEEACPFCGHGFADAFRQALPPQASTPTSARRLTRAAFFALGSGTAVIAPACATSPSSSGSNSIVPYGTPPDLVDGSVSGSSGGDSDVSPCVAAGGECTAEVTCAFTIAASCGAAGGKCCVPCEADPDVQRISASSYDQACSVDSDCVAIGVGDPCRACDILCPGNAAINKSSLSQYRKDIAASAALGDAATCSCAAAALTVCCNAGTCDPSCGVEGSAGPIQGVDASDADIEDAASDDAVSAADAPH